MNDLKVLFVYTNCMMDNLIPVGASAILSVLKSNGITVELFDTTFFKTEEQAPDKDRVENLQVSDFNYADIGITIKNADVCEEFRRQVLSFQPDIIMISMVEVTLDQGKRLLDTIEDIRPYVLAGGIHAIVAPEDVLSFRSIDAVCVGEGEDSVIEFCRKFCSGEDFTDVEGMWFKTDEAILKNPITRMVDIDKTPFLDFSLFEKERFFKPMQGKIFKMVPLEFSRGCPYRCTYCANHSVEDAYKDVGKFYRWKSLDRIFSEIEEYVNKYQVEFFYFVSETFLSMPKKKFYEFCDRYEKYKIPFWFNTRPETIKEDYIKRLENINCFRMGIGLEHGNDTFRRTMLSRKVSNKKIVDGCRIVENSKISYSLNNIIGFPGETRELIFDTINLNRQINANTVGTFVFTPFKGTSLHEYCVNNGYLDRESVAGDLNRGSILKNNILTQEEIKGLLRTFPLYVYYDDSMYPLIKKAEKFDDDGNRVFKELGDRYVEEHFGGTKK